MVTSRIAARAESSGAITMRTPLATASIAGVVGTLVRVPRKLSPSSPGGVSSFVSFSFGRLANTGTMLLQGSQASPRPSPSLSVCEVLATAGQLSQPSPTPSPSVSWKVSGGQVLLVPSQTSGTSHTPWAARHTVPAGRTASAGQTPVLLASAGQVGLAPSQTSATSQGPAAGRQTVPDGWKPSAGQAALVPVQVSATSHGPAAGRHTVVGGANASAGQLALVPVQSSATSQGPTAGRQTVSGPANWSGGQSGPVPSQTSATSQGPAAGRQTNEPPVLPRKTSGGQVGCVPSQVSAWSQTPAAGRHTVPLGASVHVLVQQLPGAPFCAVPRSHCSPGSTMPSPQADSVTVTK